MSASTLSRRSMFGLLLGTTATAALSTFAAPALAKAATPTAEMMIIYVCADDCGPCRVFEAEDLPRWMASPMARTVRLVRAKAPKTTQAFQAKYWPSEARPYMSAFRAPIVPSFMFVANGNVVASGAGLAGWRQTTLPRVQQMAQA
jgi:hypothetical protein